jgi:diguanylate cyclase (GGDEF)-like protein
VLAALLGAAVVLGVVAALDPTTLRPGAWTLAFTGVLALAAAAALALLLTGRRWTDAALGALVCLLMALVVLTVFANQSRGGGVLNVVLLLPMAVYAAVHLSRRTCRLVMVVLAACASVMSAAATGDVLQWVALTALPVVAFLGTTEVVLRLRTGLGSALEALREQARTDPLTGLLNRRALHERLAGAQGAPSGFRTVLLLDVDHFKSVNDTLGHSTGDEVLRAIGAGLRREVRRDDLVVRWGGEEFLLLSTAASDEAPALAEALRRRAAVWMAEWSVTVSVGGASLAPGGGSILGADVEAAVRSADLCLYAAKAAGRDRVVLEVLAAPPGAGGAAGPLAGQPAVTTARSSHDTVTGAVALPDR